MTTVTRPLRSLSTLLGLVALAAPAPALAADFAKLYTAGHADIEVDYVDGNLTLGYRLDSGLVLDGVPISDGRTASASEIAVVVPEALRTTGGSDLAPPFAGAPIYDFPTFGGAPVRPLLGFGAEPITGGIFMDDMLSLTLTGFSAPQGGEFTLFYSFSPNPPLINTADGIWFVDTLDVNASGHQHYAMAFTTGGIYDLEFTAYGTLVESGEVVSTTATFRFVVGDAGLAAVPEPSSLAMAAAAVACGAGLAGLRRRA